MSVVVNDQQVSWQFAIGQRVKFHGMKASVIARSVTSSGEQIFYIHVKGDRVERPTRAVRSGYLVAN
ncbi:hypothetical protein ABK249_14565 [Neorhizobium sp. Rsf11]|uniref:Uncharacterized protein n=1 Tax=Neorhizobium phenanthreniclasticum TaxID=3157917 RepID=A0ABV0M3Y9_9HYPH